MKDYTTIAPATLSDLLAEIALARRESLSRRGLGRGRCGHRRLGLRGRVGQGWVPTG